MSVIPSIRQEATNSKFLNVQELNFLKVNVEFNSETMSVVKLKIKRGKFIMQEMNCKWNIEVNSGVSVIEEVTWMRSAKWDNKQNINVNPTWVPVGTGTGTVPIKHKMSMDKNYDRGEKSGDGFFEGRIRSKMVSFTGTVFLFSLLLVPIFF